MENNENGKSNKLEMITEEDLSYMTPDMAFLSQEKYDAVWEKCIQDKRMTYDRASVIDRNLSIEEIIEYWWEKLLTMTLSEMILSKEQYQALWDIWKIHEDSIAISKINTIKKRLTPEKITALWSENIVKESMGDYKILYIWDNYSAEEIKEIWWVKLADMSSAELMLSEEQYKTFVSIWADVTDSTKIRRIANLLPIQMEAIWWKALTLMNAREINDFRPTFDKDIAEINDSINELLNLWK